MSRGSEWPPRETQAADASQLIGWKTWIAKEDRSRSTLSGSRSSTFHHLPLLSDFMARQQLSPGPAYAFAPNNLRGASRHGWEHYKIGTDPLLGYNSRWAAANSRRATPFTQMRQRSTSQTTLARALTPLDIKPVDRALIAARTRPPPKHTGPPAVHKTVSMAELAPDLSEVRSGKAKTEWNANDSTIRALAFSQNH